MKKMFGTGSAMCLPTIVSVNQSLAAAAGTFERRVTRIETLGQPRTARGGSTGWITCG